MPVSTPAAITFGRVTQKSLAFGPISLRSYPLYRRPGDFARIPGSRAEMHARRVFVHRGYDVSDLWTAWSGVFELLNEFVTWKGFRRSIIAKTSIGVRASYNVIGISK